MRTASVAARIGPLLLGALFLTASAAVADEVRVMSAGSVAPAYLKLVPLFERAKPHQVITLATSTGVGPEAIVNRVRRGEPVDVIILAAEALDELIRDGHLVGGSRVDLVRSRIGVAVRAGAPKPDIRTVEGLKRALLDAKSVAYSPQISGVYLVTELVQRLGIAEQVLPKAQRVERGPVGTVVARGEADLGVQQVSELLAVPGVDYVGPLPAEVQKISVFSAGIGKNAPSPVAARTFLEYLVSAEAASVMTAGGLEPIAARQVR